MWLNLNLEPWAYLYLDVSWVLTLGWTSLFIVPMVIIDLYYKNHEKIKFILTILTVSFATFIAEASVVYLGIREYSQDIKNTLSGNLLLGIPIEALYYIPVFVALIISFIRYWELNRR